MEKRLWAAMTDLRKELKELAMYTESLIQEYEDNEMMYYYPKVLIPSIVIKALKRPTEKESPLRFSNISIGGICVAAICFLLLYFLGHWSAWLIFPAAITIIIFDTTIAYKKRKGKNEQENKRIRQIINDPSLLRAYRKNEVKAVLKCFGQGTKTSSAQVGKYDKILFDAVREIPGSSPKILEEVDFFHSPDYRNYTPDVILHIPSINLCIDLEVDEPWFIDYSGKKQASHCIESPNDDLRDRRFLEERWIVIRFAEEQVALNPKSCAKEVAKVLTLFGLDVLDKFSNIEDLKPVNQWTEDQALKISRV